MVFSHESTLPSPSPAREGVPPASELRGLVRRLDPNLDMESPTAEAALVLLAGRHLEHNVVKLARYLGIKQPFVARCARRLVDNGVWNNGDTVCGWAATPFDDPNFWADVAVAEGKLCRRLDDEGRMQWAPGGHWWKSFDLVTHASPGQSVRYQSPPAPPSPAEPLSPAADDEAGEHSAAVSAEAPASEKAAETVSEAPAQAHEPLSPPQPEESPVDPVDSGGDAKGASAGEPPKETSARRPAGSADLFPDAVWL